MLKVVEAISCIYDTTYGSSFFLTAAEVAKLQHDTARLVRHYQFLVAAAMANELAQW